MAADFCRLHAGPTLMESWFAQENDGVGPR